jgi:hypothetical protein
VLAGDSDAVLGVLCACADPDLEPDVDVDELLESRLANFSLIAMS